MRKPSEHIREQVTVAVDALESALSQTIWRTSSRIHEVAIGNTPSWKGNPFMNNKIAFLYLLLQFTYSGGVVTERGQNIYSGKSYFEEGNSEPMIADDLFPLVTEKITIPPPNLLLPHSDTSLRTFLTELQFYECKKHGVSFEGASCMCQLMGPHETALIIAMLNTEGLSNHTIFYQESTNNKTPPTLTLPALPYALS